MAAKTSSLQGVYTLGVFNVRSNKSTISGSIGLKRKSSAARMLAAAAFAAPVAFSFALLMNDEGATGHHSRRADHFVDHRQRPSQRTSTRAPYAEESARASV
jgi:hypothetical protein